jgi:hypothetical protein
MPAGGRENVAFPDAGEIAALEYFVKHVVCGKHQRTDAETPYPYGAYGADSWDKNRFTDRDPLESESLYDSDITAYIGSKDNAEIENNVKLMKQWAREGTNPVSAGGELTVYRLLNADGWTPGPPSQVN